MVRHGDAPSQLQQLNALRVAKIDQQRPISFHLAQKVDAGLEAGEKGRIDLLDLATVRHKQITTPLTICGGGLKLGLGGRGGGKAAVSKPSAFGPADDEDD